MAATSTTTAPPKFNEILCIGLGLSGVCLGVQLKKKFGFSDVHFYDRAAYHSGTWWANRYPGCACDIPGLFYSFSFELNTDMSHLFPSKAEITGYVERIVEKYRLRPRMTFQTECESASWDSKRQLWTVFLRNIATGEHHVHECRILFSAVGVLVNPKIPSFPGIEKFQGPLFHTARWRSDVDLKDKDVVIIGNGCSASQVIPEITSKTKTLTQIIRTSQWYQESFNAEIGPYFRFALRHVPFLWRFIRLWIFLGAESDWDLFKMNKTGEKKRRAREKACTEYAFKHAPKKYHDILIPDWEVACKRRVFDHDHKYLDTLNEPNFHLTKDPIVEILPRGIRTATKTYPADVIIAATGFETNNGLGPLQIQGRDGKWLAEHWKEMGGPGAYDGTAIHGFPNFFIIYGPNASTGHTSVILAIENMVNFALKIAEPVIRGNATEVEVTKTAEIEYITRLQAASNERLWAHGGCTSWYIADGRNSMLYPWSQTYSWWRSTFPTWKDWNYKYKGSWVRRLALRKVLLWVVLSLGLIGVPYMDKATRSKWLFTAIRITSEWLEGARRRVSL